MKLSAVADTWAALRTTRSRKKKVAWLAELLDGRTEDELELVVAWLSGELRQGKIGVGFSAAYTAVRATPASTQGRWSVADVEARLRSIQQMSGAGSKKRRHEALVELFAGCTEDEQQFLVGLLTGELRQGALMGQMVDALAVTLEVDKKTVQRAAMLSGDLCAVARAGRAGGAEALQAFRMTPFTPLLPMLAKTAQDPDEVLKLHGTAAFDTKLDGVRIQVHRDGERVHVYTRKLNEISRLVPEVVAFARGLDCHRVILDGEVVALDGEGRPRSFQTVMSRFGRSMERRKTAVLVDEVPLTPVCFDLLLVDDRDLLDAPLRDRIQAMEALVPEANRVTRCVTDDVEQADAFFTTVLDAGHEGVLAKDLEAPYQAGGRGKSWLKIKPTHTFDLVVVGCDWGSGRREGWLSNIHLAVRDGETGELKMCGKTFKGMTDELLRWQTARFQELETSRTDWTVFIRPELVVEIVADSVMPSTRYPAGISLRFARVKAYRADKDVSQASTIQELSAFLKG